MEPLKINKDSVEEFVRTQMCNIYPTLLLVKNIYEILPNNKFTMKPLVLEHISGKRSKALSMRFEGHIVCIMQAVEDDYLWEVIFHKYNEEAGKIEAFIPQNNNGKFNDNLKCTEGEMSEDVKHHGGTVLVKANQILTIIERIRKNCCPLEHQLSITELTISVKIQTEYV